MQRIIKYTHCCLLCLLGLISPYVNAIEITLGTGINDDPPYVYGDKEISIDYPGVTIEILKLIEKKTNVKFTVLRQPWARVVASVKANQLDGGFHFSFKEARKTFVAYPIPQDSDVPDAKYSISSRSYALYQLKGGTTRWDGEKIISGSNRPADIGVIRGSSVSLDIKNQEIRLVRVNTDHQLLNLLLAKRIDALIGLENMIETSIQSLVNEQANLIEKNPLAVVNNPYYIAFSKKFYQQNSETAWIIWQTIEQIKQNGELAAIYARYAARE